MIGASRRLIGGAEVRLFQKTASDARRSGEPSTRQFLLAAQASPRAAKAARAASI
jgi:hypothetical protein